MIPQLEPTILLTGDTWNWTKSRLAVLPSLGSLHWLQRGASSAPERRQEVFRGISDRRGLLMVYLGGAPQESGENDCADTLSVRTLDAN
jgi:hypothetical protein